LSKKLLPIILVLFVAAGAIAGEMNYTVYGKLHMSLQMVNDSEDSQITMSSNTSRFGIKGSSEMTDTTKFIWQFESFVNPADSGGVLSNRNSFLGVKGNFGTFLYGIHDTPYKTLGRKTTFFYDTVGDNRTATMGWDRRLTNIVMYSAPKMETFMAQVAYQLDQNARSAEEAASTISAMAAYVTEELFFGAAVEMDTKGNFMDDYDNDPATPDTYTEDAPMAIRVAGKYNTDMFGVAGMFQSVSNAGGITDASQTTMGLEACYHAAPEWDVKGMFFMADPHTDVDDNEFNLVTLGVDRKFPNKLTAYAQFAMVMNGDAQAMGLGGNGWGDSVSAFAAGEGPWAFSMGFFKKF